MKVSVIVPVYNVEKYIDKCLKSLVNQTLKELEIIIVNDSSPDNSEEIINRYLKQYKNIKYYKKENGGVSEARNFGLKHATGEYITFLDSDDYISEDTYSKMYEKAKSGDFDMVACDLEYIYPDKAIRAHCNIKEDTKDIKSVYADIYPAVWNKLFKRNVLENEVYFKKNVWFEDVEFMYRILPYVKSIGVIHEPFNKYVQREGSITNTTNKRLYDYISNMNSIVDFYKERNLYDEYKNELEYVYVRYLYATFVKNTAKYKYTDYMEAVEAAIKAVNEKFPKYKKNKYFYKSLKGIYLLLFNRFIAKILYKVKREK